ncbi:hypothetical protein GpartN1_g7412.t1 [Galdieria partita]|uniref:Uncharacterized protein n=1 Tax=Galdieria partita TaxID=83374 RepID=A0A9C7Q3N3_9RHOD|nr:hypothetical protein GpartN1_g7412.t1 [Galdieria partita]
MWCLKEYAFTSIAFGVCYPVFRSATNQWYKSTSHMYSLLCPSSGEASNFGTIRTRRLLPNLSSFYGQRGAFQVVETLSTPKEQNRKRILKAIRGFPNEFNHNWNADGQRRLIDELVDFPCKFQFKIIGIRQGNFVGDIVDSVAEVLQIDPSYMEVSTRDKGKYRSITIDAPCNSSEQVYSIYAAIDRDPRVKFKF